MSHLSAIVLFVCRHALRRGGPTEHPIRPRRRRAGACSRHADQTRGVAC